MKIVGLTGGIGTGKSTVAKMLQDQGIDLIDADVLSREVVEPGGFGLRAVVSLFGSEILDSSKNQLDRKKLGEKVFAEENNRVLLERTLHPLIQWRAQQEFEHLSSIGKRLVVYDAALIYEKNLNPRFDKIIVVSATEEQQFERLSKRDRLSKEKVKERLQAQWPIQSKIDLADYVIDNSKSIDETREQVEELIKKLRN